MSGRRVRVIVRGRVQGVGFRWFTRDRAQVHGVVGWVRNRADGSVEAEVGGDPDGVEALLADLRRGPPSARVDAFETNEEDGELGVERFDRFEIR